mgnify:CR=1 FL=1
MNINTIYSQTWPKYYGQLNRPDGPMDIIELYDNGYLILGEFFNTTFTKRWGWLIKTDVNGSILWEKVIENPQEWVSLWAIEQTPDGGYVICGSVGVATASYYPLVLKLNACGVKEWCKIFKGSQIGMSGAVDVKVDNDGNIILLVLQYGSFPEETIHLFKLNNNGDILWIEPFATAFNYPDAGVHVPRSLIVTEENKYVISAKGFWEHPWNPGGGYYARPMFIMVDSTGNELWVLPFGLNDTIVGLSNHSIAYNDGNYVSVGVRVTAGPVYDGLIMSIHEDGTELDYIQLSFEQVNPDANGGELRYISEIDSLFILGAVYGDYFSPDPWPPGEILLEDINFDSLNILGSKYYPSNRPPYALATLNSGKYLSASTYPHSSTNYDIFLAKLNLNLEYDTAYTGNLTYDSLCIPGPPQSGFIYLDDCDIVLGTEMPTAAEYRARVQHIPITIYPNPAKDHVTFALENTEHHRNIELRCFNLLGVQQHQTTILRGQQQTTANLSNWPPGMYVVVVYSDGMPVGRGKFVVH